MAAKSSYFLAVLLIANPFMLLFFQNCSYSPQGNNRDIASFEDKNTEISLKVNKNLKIQ